MTTMTKETRDAVLADIIAKIREAKEAADQAEAMAKDIGYGKDNFARAELRACYNKLALLPREILIFEEK